MFGCVLGCWWRACPLMGGVYGGWLVVCGVEPCGSGWPCACALVGVAMDTQNLGVLEVEG